MSSDADTIVNHQGQLASKRSNFDTWWQSIAERVMPSSAQFTTTSEEGEKRSERLFDGSPVTANERFAAVVEDLTTPRTQRWHELATEDTDLEDNHEVQVYYQEVTRVLFAMRYRPRANFASQKSQGNMSLGAFGNSCMFIDEIIDEGPRYKQVHMNEAFWAENNHGIVDTMYRRFPLENRQAVQRFGSKLSPKISGDAEKHPFKTHEFIHCVRPNEERKVGRLDHTGMPWSSYYVDVENKDMLDVGGYTSWPFAIGRYTLAPRESYGRSPAMACWPAINTLNEEKKTVLRSGQREVDPAILLQEDGALEGFNMKSGALNYGMVSGDGRPLAVPFHSGANIPLGLELMELEKQHIDDSFLVTVFQILLENTQLTATQVLEIAQQRGVLLAPAMGRLQSEDLGPLIEREIDIASKAGLLPEMPEVLRERGATYKIEYRSPLARALRAQDGVAIARTLESMPTAISVDPNSAYVLNVPESLRELAEINGVPAKLMRDEDAIAEILEQQQADEVVQDIIKAAPDVSKSALNAAQAEALRLETTVGG